MIRPRLLLARAALVVAAACALGASCQQTQPEAPPTVNIGGIWQAHLGTEDRPQLFAELATQGFRLMDVSGYAPKGEARYASLWLFGDGRGWQELHGVDADTLSQRNESYAKAGLSPTHVSGFSTRDGPRFAAIWEPGATPGLELQLAVTEDELSQRLADDKSPSRMVDVSAYVDEGAPRFTAIWAPIPEGQPKTTLKLGLDAQAVDAAIAEASTHGARLVRFGGYEAEGTTRFYLLQVAAPGPLWMARRDLDEATYQTVLEDMVQVGYRISHLSAYTVKGEARYAVIWTQ